MADVFISYAREDKARAEQVARGLQAAGLNVFWDNEIPPGSTWADFIETKLSQCKAAVVLWSAHSTKSQWVREEARMGRDKGNLIPAMIDNSAAPFGFGEVQAANLASWNGQGDHPEWMRFVGAVRNAVGAPAAAGPTPSVARAATMPPPHVMSPPASLGGEKKRIPVWVWIAAGAVGVVVLLGIIGSMIPDTTSPAVPPQVQQAASAPEQVQQQAGQQQVTPDQQAQNIILAQLQQVQSNQAAQGFQQMGQPSTGGLQQGQMWNVPVTLTAGNEYRVAGVCDQDCRDLDLTLLAGDGHIISQDTSTDDHPVVAVQVTGSGQFTVQVNMYNCSRAPCYYAIALYMKTG